jgi:hypothetical protein
MQAFDNARLLPSRGLWSSHGEGGLAPRGPLTWLAGLRALAMRPGYERRRG